MGNRTLLVALLAVVVGLAGLIAMPTLAAPGESAMLAQAGSIMGPSMAGMMGGPVAADAQPIGIDQAAANARQYIDRFGNPNLQLGEVMEFGANYYAQAVERDTGVHAFELLIDKYSGAVFPEMGPNMAWNTKYGMMGGMMGRFQRPGQGQASAEMPIGAQRAQELAQQYLKTQGLQLGLEEPDRFYGYYTLHTLRGQEIEGMLSVNGYTGEIWYHVWHGPFIRELAPQAEVRG